jgi:hypothetical protein
MAAKLTILAHKIAIQLHLVAESCTICSSRSRQPVRKLLDTLSYMTGIHLAANFETFTRKMFQVGVFWVVTSCSVVVG